MFLVSAFAIVVRAMGFFYDEFNRFDTAGVLAGLHRQSRGMGVTESRMMIRFCGCHILGMHPRLEALTGTRSGQYSIRINQQYRLCFQFYQGHAENVAIVDYHD